MSTKNCEQMPNQLPVEEVTVKKKVAKLIDVKSLVTLTLIGGLLYGFVKGSVDPGDYFTAVLMVLSFYFGTQSAKKTGTGQ